jgi:CHC2 zinc finger/RepB DNA-primase from phage plasmid
MSHIPTQPPSSSALERPDLPAGITIAQRRRSKARSRAAAPPASSDLMDLRRYLNVLAGPQPDARLLEIRFALHHRNMGRVFIAAPSATGAARFISRLSARTDVYVGVALRGRRSGGREAIERSHLAFVEIDTPGAEARLERFLHRPAIVIASGSIGHVHAYWQLASAVGVVELERANRRLAHHLGGDPASVDAARILRPPQSLNHKHTPPAPVRLLALDPARRYQIADLVDGLSDPGRNPRLGPPARQRDGRNPLDRLLLAIPAADYVRALTGRVPNRAGKVCCPFHDDSDPSLQLYDDGSWYCFACRIGGTVYDFAAELWAEETKGRAFIDLRARLAETFQIRQQG